RRLLALNWTFCSVAWPQVFSFLFIFPLNSRRCYFVLFRARSVCLPAALGSTDRYSASFRSDGLSIVSCFPRLACATTAALTPAGLLFQGVLSRQVSCVHCITLSRPTSPNHTTRIFGIIRV